MTSDGNTTLDQRVALFLQEPALTPEAIAMRLGKPVQEVAAAIERISRSLPSNKPDPVRDGTGHSENVNSIPF